MIKIASTAMMDVMGGCTRWEQQIHNDGLVALVDVMPRLVPVGKTADFAIVQAARVSYGDGTKSIEEDDGLIRYLMRQTHTTPFEMVEFKFHHVMPIFVARQWIRHRTANVNEYSGRYSIVKDRFYRPTTEGIRAQSNKNKQGSEALVDDATAEDFLKYLDKAESLYADYENLVDRGVAKELARIGLPLNLYTEWYWKIDLHNLLHFLKLRMDSHAQQEIRDYANPMFEMIRQIVPVACQAFLDYKLNSITLSAPEIVSINQGYSGITNKREQAEFETKLKRLGL